MATNVPNDVEERTGAKISLPFPGPAQGALFATPRATWRDFLRWLVSDQKLVGAAIFGQADPEQGRINFSRVLDGKASRHLDVEWLDIILETLGREAQDAFVRFVCDRFGFEAPVRKADPVRVQEELAAVKGGLVEAISAIQKLTAAVDHISKAIPK